MMQVALVFVIMVISDLEGDLITTSSVIIYQSIFEVSCMHQLISQNTLLKALMEASYFLTVDLFYASGQASC